MTTIHYFPSADTGNQWGKKYSLETPFRVIYGFACDYAYKHNGVAVISKTKPSKRGPGYYYIKGRNFDYNGTLELLENQTKYKTRECWLIKVEVDSQE